MVKNSFPIIRVRSKLVTESLVLMAEDKKTEKTEKEKKDDQAALESVLKHITKNYGDGAIMRLGGDKVVDIEAMPTGSLMLDILTGIGGYPKGKIVEIFGPESGGKTTLTLHAIAEAQKTGGKAVFIDAEHALDPNYARNLGVDINNLLLSQPDYGEQALSIAETLAQSGLVDLIVVDSVAALVPKDELEGVIDDTQQIGLQARLMSRALRRLAGVLNRTKTCIIFTNQLRELVGGFRMPGAPVPTTTPGGRALKFYASLRLEISTKSESFESRDAKQAVTSRIKIVKNKFAPPFKKCEVLIRFGTGICKYADLSQASLETGIISIKGSWYYLGDERIGQGEERFTQRLKDEPEFFDRIHSAVREKAFSSKS